MSTIRKLRRTMVTQNPFSQLQKPRCKIADLPEDDRRVLRFLIRDFVDRHPAKQQFGMDLDTAAQAIEENIDAGLLKVIIDRTPAEFTRTGGFRYDIVPTGKF